MADMLVKLYKLPDLDSVIADQRAQGISVRGALAPQKRVVLKWVTRHWGGGGGWTSECDVAVARQPVACVLGTRGERILGFACYESTCRNFFGPTGVRAGARQRQGPAARGASPHARPKLCPRDHRRRGR